MYSLLRRSTASAFMIFGTWSSFGNANEIPFRIVDGGLSPPGVETLLTLEARPGATVRFLLTRPEKPVASVILFAGGQGRLRLSRTGRIRRDKSNFLVRSRYRFRSEGFAVATVDAPSDRQRSNGMLFGFRGSAAHARDIGAIVHFLRNSFGRPVWLIGTSRGSTSVANAGIRSPGSGQSAADGLVLTSTVTVDNGKGLNVLEMDIASIRTPVIIAHHRKDECHVTPFGNVRLLRRALKNASKVVVFGYSRGHTKRSPCHGRSYHGFLGIEARVVGDIAGSIKALLPQ